MPEKKKLQNSLMGLDLAPLKNRGARNELYKKKQRPQKVRGTKDFLYWGNGGIDKRNAFRKKN